MEIERNLVSKRKHMEEFSLLLNSIVKETDDERIKQEVKDFLTDISQAYRIIVVGREKSGRTTICRNCFSNGSDSIFKKESTEGILEIRYGAKEASMQVNDKYKKRFVTDLCMEGLAVYDVGSFDLYQTEAIKEITNEADVVIVAFSADNIQDDYTWDYIEQNGLKKKVVCIMTKADCYSVEDVQRKREQLQTYCKEIGLESPIFAVSDIEGWQKGYEEVLKYMQNNIIGINPAEQKRLDNFQKMINLHKEIKESVEKRYIQYEEDKKIVQQLDKRIDEFRKVYDVKIADLKKAVTNVISEEIIEYQNKIIKMLNPKELRKNPYTKNKQAFIEWLQEEVARCEKRLNKRVEDAAVSVSRHYISDLDNICVELKNMVEERETILSERDRFYGTLMKSKGTVATRTQQAVTQSHKEYMSLLDASEELWNSLWNERYKYDRNVVLTTTGSTVAGAITGGVLGVVAANTAVSATTAATAGAVVAATGGTIMVAAAGVGILIFGTAALFAGKKLAESIFEGKLNENSSKYILEFKETLKSTRIQMEDEVCKRLDYLFESELISMDRSFMEFRSTTNIDSLNLPLLEKEIQKMNDLVGIITEEESIYGYS